MEKEMVSDRHKSIRAIAMFSTREILLAATLFYLCRRLYFAPLSAIFPVIPGPK